jgi:hypothetical protein
MSAPRDLLDESSGPTSGMKSIWPQMDTDKKEARTRIPLRCFFIRVHLRSSVAKLVLPAVQPKGTSTRPNVQGYAMSRTSLVLPNYR